MPPTLGAILAGGLSRRMGGGDKCLRLLAGRSILDRIVEMMRPQCAALILNANGDPARFGETELPIVPDGLPDHPGPLAGVLAALDWAAQRRPDLAWVVTVAADTPFVPSDLVVRLHAARQAAGTRLACAESNGRAHPVDALWPVDIRGDLRRALTEGERRVGRWAGAQGLGMASWDGPGNDPFFNVNAPEDLAAAEHLLKLGASDESGAR